MPKNHLKKVAVLRSIGSVFYIYLKLIFYIFSCNYAIQLNPNNDYAWNNKGYALIELGRY